MVTIIVELGNGGFKMANPSYAGMTESMVKVEKSGVYRDKETGHAVSLSAGQMRPADLMERYELDASASESRAKRNERKSAPRLGGIIDAPPPTEERQTPEIRKELGLSNKAEGPTENRSDKALAADADAKASRGAK